MKKNIVIAIIALIALVGIVVALNFNSNTQESGGSTIIPQSEINLPEQDTEQPSPNIIEFTDAGYNPKELAVMEGDTVTFVNKASVQTWPASAMHPTHKAYPGSGIEKCGTPEEEGIFDACKGLPNGESFSFTFNNKGDWFYHDHLNTAFFGKITVQ